MQLFRVSIRVKETDKRKNSTVYRYIVMASSSDEAKTLAVAKWVDPEDYDYRTHTLDKIAHVTVCTMNTVVYNCDIFGDKDKSERPDTVPSPEAVKKARRGLDAFEAAAEAMEATETV